jgi:MFS family permease
MGRSTAFNATLFLTSLFGLLAFLANSFYSLCITLFFLGSAVGVCHRNQLSSSERSHGAFLQGSLPTDGTLILEYMPKRKQYLVTALSVFFSFGAVVSAIVGLAIIPRYSCAHGAPVCNQRDNLGWKYMLATLSVIVCMTCYTLSSSQGNARHVFRPYFCAWRVWSFSGCTSHPGTLCTRADIERPSRISN